MNYINNFRYGEISKKNAGRFDTEWYNQGAFRFENAKTGYIGTAERRPPLKKLIDTSGVLNIMTFEVSESLAYTIALKATEFEVYRFVSGKYQKITNAIYPVGEDDDPVSLTGQEAKEVRSAQYYTRIYLAHHTFRPIFIDINPTTDTVSTGVVKLILNQDAKTSFWFTPSYVADANGTELPGQEGRLVYEATDKDIKWYFDREFTDPYLYSTAFPPIQGQNSYINNFDEYQDTDLLDGPGNFPSGVACISDRLYFYATDNHPQAFWMSRVLGSSQWIEGYSADAMHDFVTFQVVTTEGYDVIDDSEIPMKEATSSDGTPLYEQSNGETLYFTADKDADGNYTYEQRIYPKPKEVNSDEYDWFVDEACTIPYTLQEGEPKKKPVMIYDVANLDQVVKTTTSVSFITNDSCGGRYEPNTGRFDRIMAIESGCEKIFLLTTTSEHVMPSDFSALSNLSASKFTSFASAYNYMVHPVMLNNSFLFLQKSNVLREFYLYQGYLNNNDVTIINHDILKGTVTSMCAKNTPDPCVFFVMSDGTMRALTYDKSNSIQSFSRWNFKDRNVLALCTIEHNNENLLLALVSSDTEEFIGYFDEAETKSFIDYGEKNYETVITTPFIEIHDTNYSSQQGLTFGKTKQATNAYLRAVDTGKVIVEDNSKQRNVSNYDLSEGVEDGCPVDYRMPLDGRSSSTYSLSIRSYEDDPMNILAFGYEVS